MAKRKSADRIVEVSAGAEDDTEEETEIGEESALGPGDEKRRRRVSDVIDSIGDRGECCFPEVGPATPRRATAVEQTDWNSPDQGYSTTPDRANASLPDWLDETPDTPDARPGSFDEFLSSGYSGSETVAAMPVPMGADRYNMSHRYRGKCVVFNHEYFDTGFEDREGSSVDARRIRRTFGNLGFQVEILDNLEHADVVDKITKLSEEDHRESDCVCVFVLTHGISNDMICAKDAAYKAEKIWKPFTGDRCKSLAGKPKLFFLQACRGSELDAGVTLARTPTTLSSETDSTVTSYKIPTHADFLIAHSSAQGFYSWRNPTEGTWFVQCLCQVIDEYAETTDLLKMLTITARKISTERASFNDLDPTKHDKKQVPSITTMLLRDVYFTPK